MTNIMFLKSRQIESEKEKRKTEYLSK